MLKEEDRARMRPWTPVPDLGKKDAPRKAKVTQAVAKRGVGRSGAVRLPPAQPRLPARRRESTSRLPP